MWNVSKGCIIMKLTLNDAGKKLCDKWWENYCQENDRKGGNSAEGDFVEGWSIIDDSRYVKTVEDVCGLLIFGYDADALNALEDWFYGCGDDYKIYGFTYDEIKAELLKYNVVED